MKIGKNEVMHVADLACLKIDDSAVAKFSNQIGDAKLWFLYVHILLYIQILPFIFLVLYLST